MSSIWCHGVRRRGGRITHSPVKVHIYLGMFIKWREGPEELICMGTLIFLRRRNSVPLLVTAEGCLSIPRVEKGEVRSR